MGLISERRAARSQFEVEIDGDRATILFNGQKIERVKRVSVSNDVDADDIVTSTISIDLVGEAVLMTAKEE